MPTVTVRVDPELGAPAPSAARRGPRRGRSGAGTPPDPTPQEAADRQSRRAAAKQNPPAPRKGNQMLTPSNADHTGTPQDAAGRRGTPGDAAGRPGAPPGAPGPVGRCRCCGRPVVFRETPSGRSQPWDVDPGTGGLLAVRFATCPARRQAKRARSGSGRASRPTSPRIAATCPAAARPISSPSPLPVRAATATCGRPAAWRVASTGSSRGRSSPRPGPRPWSPPRRAGRPRRSRRCGRGVVRSGIGRGALRADRGWTWWPEPPAEPPAPPDRARLRGRPEDGGW